MVLLTFAAARSPAQVTPPELWTFLASGPADSTVPAATPDGGVVIVVPQRLSSQGVELAPRRVQKIRPDGILAWQHDLTWDWLGWPVVLEDGAVLVAEGSPPFAVGRLHCFEAAGAVRWSFDPAGSPVIPPVVDGADRIWIAVTDPDSPNAHTVIRLNTAGDVELRRSLGAWVHGPGSVLADGQFILPVGGGVVSIGSDGAPRWASGWGLGATRAPALAADGTIVVTSANGWVRLLNPDGSLRAESWPGSDLLAPLAGADGTLYVLRSDGRLDVRDRQGDLLRQIEFPVSPGFVRPIEEAPALADNGWLWLPLRNGQVVAYGPSGELAARWASPASTLSGGAPLLRTDGSLVAGLWNRRVVALGGAGGPMAGAWPLLAGNPARTGRQAPMPLPEAPNQLAATETNGTALLTWTTPPGLVTAEVWRGSTTNRDQATRVAAFQVTTKWADPDVVVGHEYYYWVRTRNAAGAGPASGPVPFRRATVPPGYSVARWKLADGELSAPAQGADQTLYVGDAKGGLTAVAADGTRRWRFATGQEETVGAPLAAHGGVYFAATLSGIYGLTAEGSLRFKLPYQQVFGTTPITPALTGEGNLLLTGIAENQTWVALVSPDGEVRHTAALGNWPASSSSPVIASDDSFWLGVGDLLTRFDRQARPLWSVGTAQRPRPWPLALDANAELLSGSSGTTGGFNRFRSDGTPRFAVPGAVTGGAVVDAQGVAYFGNQGGRFGALSPDGEARWEVDCGAAISCAPALGEPDVVYVASEAGRLLALDRSNGAEQWRVDLGAKPLGGLVLIEPGELAVSTADGVLHRIQLAGGAPAGASWPMLGRNAAHHGRLPTPLPALVAPAPVVATDAATNSDVVIRWTPVPGAAWYEVLRAPTNDFAAASPLSTNFTGASAFTDYFVPPNQPHWYWVRAATPDGAGPWSQAAPGSQGARRWRVSLPGPLFGPPAIGEDGTAYVLTSAGSERRATLIALSGATGEEVWRRSSGEPGFTAPDQPVMPVIAEDGRIFFPGRRSLACVSATGEWLWEQTQMTNPVAGPLAITRSGLLIGSSGNRVVAHRAADGLALWQAASGSQQPVWLLVAADGAIWSAGKEVTGNLLALNPNGTVRYSPRLSSFQAWAPALSPAGYLLCADRAGVVRLYRPDGTNAPPNPLLQTHANPLAVAEDQFAIVKPAPTAEIIQLNTNAQVVSRQPAGERLSQYPHVAVDRERNWYLAHFSEVRVVNDTGEVRARWSLLSVPLPAGVVLGDDGTLFVAEPNSLVAFAGFAPPAADAWAMPRKDRRNSASWEAGIPAPEPPTDFTLVPSVSLNSATLRWNRPNTLTLIELWRNHSPQFASAVRLLGPGVALTNYTDRTRSPGSTAYYWLRALDLNGQEVARLGPIVSTTVAGPSIAWTTPLSASGGQLALAPDGTLYHLMQELTAYRPDGSVRWQQTAVSGFAGSPPVIAADGTIIGWEGRELFAVNADGTLRWRHLLSSNPMAAAEVAVSESGLVVAAGAFGLQALRLTGEKLWERSDEAYAGVVLGPDDTVYATTSSVARQNCFTPGGESRWELDAIGADPRQIAFDAPGLLVTPRRVAPPNGYELQWINSAGEEVHRVALDGIPVGPTLGPAGWAVPRRWTKNYPDVIALLDADRGIRTRVPIDCTALTATADGAWLVSSPTLLALMAGEDGTLRWTYEPLAGASAVSPTALSPDGRIYFAAGANLHALDSSLRPAQTGWFTTRANNRRTGQGLALGPDRPRFVGIASRPDEALELRIFAPAGTTNELQRTSDWQEWTRVEQFNGAGEPVVLVIPIGDTAPAGYFRVISQSAP